MALSEEVRRVVTTVDANGKAVVLFDGDNPHKVVREGRKTVSRLLWTTQETPADIAGPLDRATVKVGVAPTAGGSIFRIVDIPPTPKEVDDLPLDYHHAQHGASTPKRHMPPRHPLMHATRTVDYAIILFGEMYAVMEEGETLMKAGDVLVQRGTNHSWSNRSGQTCRVAFILVDGRRD